jgi:hypothetical protein
MIENATSTDARFDAIEAGDQVNTLGASWLTVVEVVTFLCTITWRQRVRLHLVDTTGQTFELTDGPDGTIEHRTTETGATAVTLLRLISARADGEIGGPTVDAKIAELTERFGVTVTTS